MSTTIDVIPMIPDLPLVEQTRHRADELFQALLDQRGIDVVLTISATTQTPGSDRYLTPAPLDLRWSPGLELCFTYAVNGVAKCSSWPFCTSKDLDLMDADEIDDPWWDETDFHGRVSLERLQRATRIGHYWYEYRNAGGPAIASIGYGLVAAALAEATEGVIATWDGAFDEDLHNRESAAEFLTWWGDHQLDGYGTEPFFR